jgi:hypothetical protein
MRFPHVGTTVLGVAVSPSRTVAPDRRHVRTVSPRSTPAPLLSRAPGDIRQESAIAPFSTLVLRGQSSMMSRWTMELSRSSLPPSAA